MRSKNFYFLKKIDIKIYNALCDIEHDAYINPIRAAHECRIVLEKIVDKLLEKNGLERSLELADNLWALKNNRLAYPRPHNLPRVEGKCINYEGSIIIEKLDAYTFLRKLGNVGSHFYVNPKDIIKVNPIPIKENIFKALFLLHLLIREVYAERIAEDVPAFSEQDIPIGDFYIEEVIINIADKPRTNCCREYRAYRYESDNIDKKIYGLIREYEIYNLGDYNMAQFDRMLDVYGVMGSQMRKSGITLKKLNEPGTDYTNYYVVYEYDKDMFPLKDLLSRNVLDLQAKLDLCLEIAKKLQMFHSAEEQIYLRLLTHDSIMIRKATDGTINGLYEPVIIKYEFAKINQNPSSGITVIELLKKINESGNQIISQRMQRYCVDRDFDYNTDWEKVDVGSLGVLFIDICKGRISTKEPKELLEEFAKKQSVSADMHKLMAEMIDSDSSNRPNLGQVIDEMREIANCN